MSKPYSSVRECFEAALELPAASRAVFLLERCSDPAMRRQVERMLAVSEGESRGILGLPVETIADRLSAVPGRMDPAGWLGRRVGDVQLLDLLGQGGSAVVFRGERRQQDVVQPVAVKLFRQVLLTDAEVRRFRRERSAMVQLNHPHIARLIDGGTTDGGLAYIVLEYVDGRRITDYASGARLDLRARLRLMIQVCRAVEAAHRALIVHRDLKPSNVLVTQDGQVKLLDFGIAKFLDVEEEATEAGHAALTPAYAAPEQFRGEAVTTATDVYALGVLLGELLTGERPSGGAGRPPSAALNPAADARLLPGPPARLRQQLRGDIDNIVLKATAPDPQRRYVSAGALADDLERYLDSRPVRAHPPSRRYRLGKFYQRHRAAMLVAAVFLLLLLAAVAAALWQARAATAHAERARVEAELSRATRDFMVEVFRQAEPAGARAAPPTVIEVTEAALTRIDEDRRMDLRVRLDLKTRLGAVLRGQSKMERGIAVLRQAYAEGVRSFGRSDGLVVDAGLELVDALVTAGDYEAAGNVLREMQHDLSAQDVDRNVTYQLSASTVAAMRGRDAEAMAHIEAARQFCRRDCSDAILFSLRTSEGTVNGIFGRNAAAAEAWSQAAALAESLHGPTHAMRAQALNGLGGAYGRMNRLDDAKRLALQVLEIDDRIRVPAMHWQRSLHLNKLGTAHYLLGEYEEALKAYTQALLVARTVNGEEDQQLSADIQNIGVVYSKLGRFQESETYLRDALQRRAAADGERSRTTAHTRANLANVLALKGDREAALPLFDRAVSDLRAAGDGARRQLFDALRNQARAQLVQAPALALDSVDEALQLAVQPSGPPMPTMRLGAEAIRGVALQRLGRVGEAEALLRAVQRELEQLGADHNAQAQVWFALGRIELTRGRCAQAREALAAGKAALAREPFAYAYLKSAQNELKLAMRASCAH